MFVVNRNPTPRDLKWFALGMIIGAPLLAGMLLLASKSRAGEWDKISGWLLYPLALAGLAGVMAGATSLALPRAGRTLYIGWMTITLPVGLAMSTVLLTVLYFVLLPVFSLIVRRKDPLRKKLGGATYWEAYRAHEPTLERLRRPF